MWLNEDLRYLRGHLIENRRSYERRGLRAEAIDHYGHAVVDVDGRDAHSDLPRLMGELAATARVVGVAYRFHPFGAEGGPTFYFGGPERAAAAIKRSVLQNAPRPNMFRTPDH